MSKQYDFAGWASRNNIRCTDGRTIQQGAFKDMDGRRVPLVYMHNHSDIENVLGHCDLTYKPEGLWAEGFFNGTEKARHAQMSLEHGDITALSIFANQLRENNGRVYHGVVKEVSLVLAGANSGATIEYPIIEHSDGTWESDFEAEEAVISMDSKTERLYLAGEDPDTHIEHADSSEKEEDDDEEEKESKKSKTLTEIIDGLPEEEANVVYTALAYVAKNGVNTSDGNTAKHDDMEEDDMSFNVFDRNNFESDGVLSHAEFMDLQKSTFAAVKSKQYSSLREAFLAHADKYGIESIDLLFPEAKQINGNTPEFLNYDQEWVKVVMDGVKHSPISRIKTVYANITEDDARAKGYIKGNRKTEEIFGLLRRATTPATIYKKQKLDRDDILDITDFDVVAWIKGEMRVKLNEEIARAILFSDGRSSLSEDKIPEEHIRPIIKEDDLFCIKQTVQAGNDDDETAKNVIKAAIKAQDEYEGSGNLTMFMPQSLLSDMLLLEDGIGHPLYASKSALETKMLVSRIVTVPRQVWPNTHYALMVNLKDYTVGADKGGNISLFEGFDIDYNQEKYLMETRISGSMTHPYSAIALKKA